MSSIDNKEIIIDFNKFKPLDRIAVNRYGHNDAIHSYLFMYPLSDRDEEIINRIKRDTKEDRADYSRVELNDGIIISLSDIKVYGEVDFNDANDCKVVKELLAKDIYECHRIPKEYNYESNTSTSKGNFIQWTETTDYIKAFKYYLSRIGKPKKIIILKLNKNAIRRK